MTAENNGVPEDDDPFAYLYRSDGDGSGSSAEAPTQQQGVPRTSYAQATQVGRTQYGQQRYQQPGYGYPPAPPTAPTQAMPQQQGYAPPPGGGRAAGRSGGGSGGGRGVAIGAVAVVLAVAIGIGVAMFNSSGDKNKTASGNSPSAVASQSAGGPSASASASASGALPPVSDADQMQVSGAPVMGDHTGAKSKDGKFVATMSPGAAITWTVTAPADGQYQLWIRYANASGDTKATITTNGTPKTIKLKNYSHTNDWNNAWYFYWTIVQLKAGANTIVLSSTGGGQGNYNVDQLALTQPCDPGNSCKPASWS